MHKCDLCNREFKRKENKERHITNKVCQGKKFSCKYCDNRFTTKISAYRHMRENCAKANVIKHDKADKIDDIYDRLAKLEQENAELRKGIIKSKSTKSPNKVINGGV